MLRYGCGLCRTCAARRSRRRAAPVLIFSRRGLSFMEQGGCTSAGWDFEVIKLVAGVFAATEKMSNSIRMSFMLALFTTSKKITDMKLMIRGVQTQPRIFMFILKNEDLGWYNLSDFQILFGEITATNSWRLVPEF